MSDLTDNESATRDIIPVWTCPKCHRRTGLPSCAHCWVPAMRVEYVPSDDAAIERVRAYLCTIAFSSLPDCGGDRRAIAEGCLRAAAGKPN